MYFGITLIGIGIVWYIVHTIIYNYYLGKNAPDLLQQPQNAKASGKGKGRKSVTVVVREGVAPAWVALLGIPPIPMVLLGVLILIIAAVISLFR